MLGRASNSFTQNFCAISLRALCLDQNLQELQNLKGGVELGAGRLIRLISNVRIADHRSPRRNCKSKKVKCGEEKPRCLNCDRNGEQVCDYSIRLNWGGRAKRKGTSTPDPPSPTKSSQSHGRIPGMSTMSFNAHSPGLSPPGHLDSIIGPPGLPPSAGSLSHPLVSPPAYQSPGLSSEGMGSPQGYELPNQRPSSNHSTKRPRHSSGSDFNFDSNAFQNQAFNPSAPNQGYVEPNSYWGFTPDSPFSTISSLDQSIPRSYPTALPATSQEQTLTSRTASPSILPNNDDPRRLSVNSLLIQEEAEAKTRPHPSRQYSDDRMRFYGIDRGLPDLDVPRNDDTHALDMVTPVLENAEFGKPENEPVNEFGFGLSSNNVSYYVENLPVRISKALLPLPTLLTKNPMNLMYFHFFIEFTAKILVPHDCPANPFRTILPQSKFVENGRTRANCFSGCER